MIFNSNEIYATVWEATLSENKKYMDLRISTSEKDADGNWKNSNWFARVIGHALNSLKGVKREDRITITKSKFTNEPYEDAEGNKRSYFKFVIIEASINSKDDKPTAGQAPKKANKPKKAEPTPQKTADESESDPW